MGNVVDLRGDGGAGGGEGGFLLDHGYVFEVDPASQEANKGKSPVPLKFLGRYAHEAVAVDPASSAIYLTETRPGRTGCTTGGRRRRFPGRAERAA